MATGGTAARARTRTRTTEPGAGAGASGSGTRLELLDHVEAERGGAHPVDHAVVEGHGEIPDRPHDDLAVADDRALADPVDAEDRDLGVVHERRHEEPAEPACARHGERRAAELVRGEAALARAVGEPPGLGVDLVDVEPLAPAHDGNHEAVVGLNGDSDVDAVEQHDRVPLEPGVELGEASERLRTRVDRMRDET